MKAEVKGPIVVVAVIALVAVIVLVGFKSVSGAGDLDQGQIKYTPGKPPWLETDPSKKGPGGAPSGNMPVGAPTIGNTPK